jgi:hypothetical protein
LLIDNLKYFKDIKLYIYFFFRIKTPKKTPDRFFLETKIFPYLNSLSRRGNKLLFIGVGQYTWHYYQDLKYNVFTIDYDKSKEKFGAKNHVVGSAVNLDKFYKKNTFNTIIINGVVGFGINSKQDFKNLIFSANNVLTRQGLLIIGFNNKPKYLDYDLVKVLSSFNFAKFVPEIAGVKNNVVKVKHSDCGHTFVFLKKIAI